MPSFIADGQYFWIGINPEPGVHEGIELLARPMTPTEAAVYVDSAGGVKGLELRQVQAETLMNKISQWRSRKDADGKRPKIPKLSKEILVGEHPPHIETNLLSRIIDVTIWGSAPDYRCDEGEEEAVKN